MKLKLFFIIGLLVVLVLPAGAALADNGPHGGYTATTDACAGCHRAHTAVGPKLLIADSTLALCMTCHGSIATGADTNVVDGVYLDRDPFVEAVAEGVVNRGLKGGGFTNASMDTGLTGAAASAGVTSSHINDGSAGTAWGNGAIGSGAGAANFTLSCASCHDPHGGAGLNGEATYRILRAVPINSGGAGHTVPDVAAKTYTVTDANGKYFGEGYPTTGGGTWGLMTTQYTQLSDWCTQCHSRYLAQSGDGSTDSGDAIFAYRHMSQGQPGATCNNCHNLGGTGPFLKTTAGPEWHHEVECMTCHVAHGTSATMPGFAGTVEWPDGGTAPNGDARSSLLRVDGRGVCQSCHGKQ